MSYEKCRNCGAEQKVNKELVGGDWIKCKKCGHVTIFPPSRNISLDCMFKLGYIPETEEEIEEISKRVTELYFSGYSAEQALKIAKKELLKQHK